MLADRLEFYYIILKAPNQKPAGNELISIASVIRKVE
jgi:hypothetical protein